MLYDLNFLTQLNKQSHKTIHAKVIAYDLNHRPLQNIEGRVTAGNITVDGSSAVRRSCSLSLAVQNFKLSDYEWTLNTLFDLEIGVTNTVDNSYPEIIWFNQGSFLITSFNAVRSTNNFTISLQGRDKMVLLNGEFGGSLEASIDFGVEKTIEEVEKKVPLYDIIRNIVHIYGKEPYHNIKINDLDAYGLELLEYRGNSPLYLLRQGEVDVDDYFVDLTGNGNTLCTIHNPPFIKDQQSSLETIEKWGQYDFIGNTLIDYNKYPSQVQFNTNELFKIVKLKYGNTIGYRLTDLVYAGELIANAGESVTSILDKIVQMLGPYEYFYNTDGEFVFQKKLQENSNIWGFKTNLNEIELSDNLDFTEAWALSQNISYNFNNSELITNLNSNINLQNVKNDFSLWGSRTSASGAELNPHVRYALDDKPKEYFSIQVYDYELEEYNEKWGLSIKGQSSIHYIASDTIPYTIIKNKDETIETIYCDWREILYQMASDYYKYNHLENFQIKLSSVNPDYLFTGLTGYEQYYVDIFGFWRELYYPKEIMDNFELPIINQKLAVLNLTKEKRQQYEEKILYLNKKIENYYLQNNNYSPMLYGWNKNIIEAPENLIFWFDFFDVDMSAELNKYSVKSIGSRPLVETRSEISTIYYLKTPSIIFVEDIQDVAFFATTSQDFSYLQAPAKELFVSLSSQSMSLMERLEELLNSHTFCVETVTLTTVPIYSLEPNSRIKIADPQLGIESEYLVSQITIPLSHNGTMQINAQKAIINLK